jgi:hypothetical protein
MTRAFYGTVKIRSSVAAQRTGINDQTVERMEEFLSCQERDLGLA